jgi:hypothetical protein
MRNVFLCDLDGTVADCSHRLHFIKDKPKNWKAFFAACIDDKLIFEVAYLIRVLADAGKTIVYMSGRSDEVRSQTEDWLSKNHLPVGKLYMRRAGDYRVDSVVKSEMLDAVLEKHPAWTIAGVFDDRQQVVDMYRSRGFRVYQVAKGDF